MTSYTINTLLCLQKNLKARLVQLKEIENQSTKKTHWMETDKVETPTYDIKLVDKKVVKLNRALFDIDMKLKEVNAMTKLELDLDYDDLMAALD